ncbi:MAG: MaoC/PaaZ C-terminal domain-containing protein [Acidimicrobiia bacterium]
MSGDLSELVGRRYGPFHLRTSVEKVEEFVTATGDDPGRWEFHVPPGFAAVALFKTAPAFFEDEDAAEYAKTLVHVDQTFRWHRPLPQEIDTRVIGEVESVRHRGEMFFVTFTSRTEGDDGTLFLEASSTFLMTEGSLPKEKVSVESEPGWDERGEHEVPTSIVLPSVGESLPDLMKSASRADLVRYAGATRDWNPIHWDHDAAVEAGLPGIIAHGLLMAAWVSQAAGRTVSGPHPLESMRLRFRQPLRPAAQAEVSAEVKAPNALACVIRSNGVDLVTADATLTG